MTWATSSGDIFGPPIVASFRLAAATKPPFFFVFFFAMPLSAGIYLVWNLRSTGVSEEEIILMRRS
jgi:hypothetical protein